MHKLKQFLFCFILLSLFVLPIYASTNYIQDDYGLLSDDEMNQLETIATNYSQNYDCGMYVRVIDEPLNISIEQYAEDIYLSEDMGIGSNHTGILLLINMDDRSYDIAAYGTLAHQAFTDYGKEQLANRFVPYLSDGDYFTAFEEYLSTAAYLLEQNEIGTPIDIRPNNPSTHTSNSSDQTFHYFIIFGLPFIISALICFGLYSMHKTKGRKYEASHYIADGGIHLTMTRDIFLYRSESRTPLPRNDNHSGGGTHINSSGFSHHSGRF